MGFDRLLLLIPAIIATLGSAPAHAQAFCSGQTTPLTNTGRVLPGGMIVWPGQLLPVDFNDAADAMRYFRALLTVSAPSGATWHLTIRDQQLRALETVASASMADGTSRWTGRIEARNSVYFDLDSTSRGVTIELKRIIVMPESAENPYYSLQNPGVFNFVPVQDADSAYRRLGDYVGFLMTSWGTRSWCCSGVVVGDDMFLTNWHCGGDEERTPKAGFWTRDVCENTIIDLSWDGDKKDREFVCTEVIDKNEENDFALLRIRPLRGEDSVRKPAIRREPVKAGEALVVVHHPACRAKQVGTNCKVRDETFPSWRGAGTSDFTHPCDTEQGSSGAAIFDSRNQLVGIHHLGFQVRGGACDKLNKGVRIQSIIDAASSLPASRMSDLYR